MRQCHGKGTALRAQASQASTHDALWAFSGEHPGYKHWCLGLTVDALLRFLEEIQFPYAGCAYEGAYERPADVIAKIGPMKQLPDGSPDLDTLTVYDLIHSIANWLNDTRNQQHSVAEVLFARGWEGVGYNDAYLSCPQVCLVSTNLRMMAKAAEIFSLKLPKGRQTKYWRDAWSIKQCQPYDVDAEPAICQSLIRALGVLVVDPGNDFLGFKRTWVAFEIAVAWDSNCDLLVFPSHAEEAASSAVAKVATELKFIRCNSAVARSRAKDGQLEQNKKITDFIRKIGFDTLDQKVMEALDESADHMRQVAFSVPSLNKLTKREKSLPHGDDHLLLGITVKGMQQFLRRLNFPKDYDRKHTFEQLGQRDWITAEFGDRRTGYDLQKRIQLFCHDLSRPNESVNEILLREGNPEVGYHPDVFLSHIQLLQIIEALSTMNSGAKIFTSEMNTLDPTFWVDFFSLRQCVDDFNLEKIVALISHIGLTLMEVPERPQDYMMRQFCVFELYATIAGGGRLLCFPRSADVAKQEALEDADRKAANLEVTVQDSSVSKGDEASDAYMKSFISTVGFSRVNEKIKQALSDGVNKYRAAYLRVD